MISHPIKRGPIVGMERICASAHPNSLEFLGIGTPSATYRKEMLTKAQALAYNKRRGGHCSQRKFLLVSRCGLLDITKASDLNLNPKYEA